MTQKSHLKTKLTRVLNSSKAYPVQFLATTASPVPTQVRQLTKSGYNSEKFIEASRQLANYLFEQHTGATSPGLLCVNSKMTAVDEDYNFLGHKKPNPRSFPRGPVETCSPTSVADMQRRLSALKGAVNTTNGLCRLFLGCRVI